MFSIWKLILILPRLADKEYVLIKKDTSASPIFVSTECGLQIKYFRLSFKRRADPAFLIRGGPNSEIFLLDLRKLLKRNWVFCSIENLTFRVSTFYQSVLIITRNWVYINHILVTIYLFLIKKTFTYFDTFLGGFYLNPKLSKLFDLVLPLGFEVINVKICIRKILNGNFILSTH